MLRIAPALPLGVDVLSSSGVECHVAGFLNGLCDLLLAPLVDRIDAAIDDAAARLVTISRARPSDTAGQGPSPICRARLLIM